MDQQQKDFDFTKALNEIEEINRWFQNEDINLDEGLIKFRRGLELIKQCKEKLRQVENEFTIIKKELASTSEATEEKTPEEIPFQ